MVWMKILQSNWDIHYKNCISSHSVHQHWQPKGRRTERRGENSISCCEEEKNNLPSMPLVNSSSTGIKSQQDRGLEYI